MANFWRKKSTKVLLEHPRITIVEDEVVLPTGTETKYIRFDQVSDFITIIPKGEKGIALIKEYSYPLDTFLLQFPEGTIESDETILGAAQRELAEEARIQATNILLAGKSASNHRRDDAWQHIALAVDSIEFEEPGIHVGDEEEFGTTVAWFSEEDIDRMIGRGEIVQRNALTAWAIYRSQSSS